MIVLRDYQDDLVARVGQALRRVRRVVVVLPPGGGKTVIAAFIAQRFAGRHQATYFNCHRAELLKQTSGTFTDCGLPHGFIAAKHEPTPDALVQVCSIDTLKNRLQRIPEPRVAIWDECHHLGAAGWAAIMAAWPNALHIGLTGSLWRMDGSGFRQFFEEMVLGPDAAQLIAMGNLAPYELYAPSAPDMNGVKKQAGDFAKGQAAERMREPKLVGDIIQHWRKHADGMRTVGYAVNIANSLHLAETFNAAGIPAAHLDGDTPGDERTRTIQRFADGELRVLFNVGLFGEGFDLSAWAGRKVTIDAGILADPTQSLAKYLQEVMRPMRPAPGKTAILLDHAGNSDRHGFPDDEFEWTLDGNPKRKAANDNGPSAPLTCTGCFRQIRRPAPPCCPSCGAPLRAEVKPLEVAAGTLERKTKEQRDREREQQRDEREQRKREENDARTLEALVALARRRGYTNPTGWAWKRWQTSPWRRAIAQRKASA